MKKGFTHLWQLLGQTISTAKVYLQGYKSYKVILQQTTAGAPVVLQELENSLGLEVVYSYVSTGVYGVTLSKDLFADENYTLDGLLYSVHITPESNFNGTYVHSCNAYPVFIANILITTTQSGDTGGLLDFPVAKDSILSNLINKSSIFEIRVYNK